MHSDEHGVCLSVCLSVCIVAQLYTQFSEHVDCCRRSSKPDERHMLSWSASSLKERSHCSSHLTSSDLIAIDWVGRLEATQFAVAATDHSALSSDELRSAEIWSDGVR